MPIHVDACLGYRASGARVKVTGKPGRGARPPRPFRADARRLAENRAHVHATRRGDTLTECATRVTVAPARPRARGRGGTVTRPAATLRAAAASPRPRPTRARRRPGRRSSAPVTAASVLSPARPADPAAPAAGP